MPPSDSPDAHGHTAHHRHDQESRSFRSSLGITVGWAFRAYRATISRGDGDRCRFHPSCSAYMEDAVRDRGPLLGVWWGMDRLMRDHPYGGWPYPGGFVAGRGRVLLDPVQEHTFWCTDDHHDHPETGHHPPSQNPPTAPMTKVPRE